MLRLDFEARRRPVPAARRGSGRIGMRDICRTVSLLTQTDRSPRTARDTNTHRSGGLGPRHRRLSTVRPTEVATGRAGGRRRRSSRPLPPTPPRLADRTPREVAATRKTRTGRRARPGARLVPVNDRRRHPGQGGRGGLHRGPCLAPRRGPLRTVRGPGALTPPRDRGCGRVRAAPAAPRRAPPHAARRGRAGGPRRGPVWRAGPVSNPYPFSDKPSGSTDGHRRILRRKRSPEADA